MKIVESIKEIKEEVSKLKISGSTIGFVPTMGALHQGHLSLIASAKKSTDRVVCSIFVNPIQFNLPADLEKYPRTLAQDLEKLESAGCDIVFVPSEKEMYPEPVQEYYHFGKLEKVMEGVFRPGHFQGVAAVVRRLFSIITPNKAFFGEKDFQQLQIIRQLNQDCRLGVEVVPCPIVREKDGLAMSSRNMRIAPQDRPKAALIHQTLSQVKEMANQENKVAVLKKYVTDTFSKEDAFRLEYFEIVEETSLQSILWMDEVDAVVACIAVWLGEVRLIDMVRMK